MSKLKDAIKAIREGRESEIPLEKKGKRGNPFYTQVNAYIPKEKYKMVKIALIQDNEELSTLLEHLLDNWLQSRK